jgi:hypothetical protein
MKRVEIMIDRESALQRVAVGDIIHARASNRASLVCLVTALDDGTIYARRIHTQDDVQFDRHTGFESGKDHTKIDCVAPLPPEIYDVFLEMDRRYQAAHARIAQGIEVDPKEARWTPEERRAHGLFDEHLEANPI